MKKVLEYFDESTEELLLRKFRVLVREKNERLEQGDLDGYAHATAQAELVARKIIDLRIQ